jgi:hypothetical protein
MDFTALLEIVISLAAMFWLLSMISSFMVEALNSLVRNIRAEALERFVCEMILGDGALRGLYKRLSGKMAGDESADPFRILSHGLVQSLRKPKAFSGGESTAPSYIPREILAKALLDRLSALAIGMGHTLDDCKALLTDLSDASAELDQRWRDFFGEMAASVQPTAGNLVVCIGRLFADLDAKTPTEAVADLAGLEAALAKYQTLNRTPAGTARALQRLAAIVGRLRASLSALGDPKGSGGASLTLREIYGQPSVAWIRLLMGVAPTETRVDLYAAVAAVVDHGPLPAALRDALRPIVANANFDLAALRKGLEDWFDSVMERATGWFKRHTTLLLGICGLVLAGAFNINPISMTIDLVEDPALRRAGVSFANQIVEQQGDSGLARRYYFAIESQRRDWEQSVTLLSKGRMTAKEFDDVAQQMQLALLRSGQMIGLLPDLRKPGKAPLVGQERDRFLTRVCVAWHETQRRSAADKPVADKPPESIRDCPRLAADFGILPAQAEHLKVRSEVTTSVINTPADQSAGKAPSRTEVVESQQTRYSHSAAAHAAAASPATSPAASAAASAGSTGRPAASEGGFEKGAAGQEAGGSDFVRFWSSSDVVWDIRLGRALARLRVTAAAGAEGRVDADLTDEFLDAFQVTKKQAEEASQYVNAFINRIPSLGWRLDPFASFWDDATAITKKVAWGLIGWPLTALMVSFGAAFWFDLLSKLMNRRVTGPKPEATKEDSP